MIVKRLCLAGLLTSALWIGDAVAGDHLEAHRIKTCTPDGVCYPNRQAYGYYQTQWRKWPGTELASFNAPAKSPEPLPPPRQAPRQSPNLDTLPGGDLPADAMDDDMPLPGEDSDTMPAPPRDSSPTESQPAVPRNLQRNLPQPPLDQDLRNLLPDEEEEPTAAPKAPSAKAPSAAEPDDALPPEMPGSTEEEDPFKDEPLPGDPNNGTGRRSAPLRQSPNQRADNMRWRTAPGLAVKAAVRDSQSSEPRLLHSSAGKSNVRRSSAEIPANPLRAASAVAKPKARRPQPVVPTADWSQDSEVSAAANLWRNNPLRVR